MADKPGVIVAFDHGPLGLLPGLDRMDALISAFEDLPLDGLILNYGVLKRFGRAQPSMPVTPIARLDGNRTVLGGDWSKSAEWELFYSVEACQRVGARAAIVNLLLGGPAEMASLRVVAQAAAACQRAKLPLYVSAMCVGDEGADWPPGHRQAFSALMAYELGADVVIVYEATAGVLAEVRRWCPLPLYAQGAPSAGHGRDLEAWAAQCVAAGAKGVIVGRSVWQSTDPGDTLRRLLVEMEIWDR